MMGTMFEGIPTDGPFDGGPGEEMFRSLMVDEYSKQMAAQGGIGLSQSITRELLKMQEKSNDTPDQASVERLVALAERLIAALEADIAALKDGKPQNMQTPDPEIQKLTALYSREAGGFSPASAKGVPKQLMARLFDSTAHPRVAGAPRESSDARPQRERGHDPRHR